MQPEVKKALNGILQAFESGNIPEAVAYSCFPAISTPCAKWSFTNRTLVFLSGTMDARGFQQWKEANRFVKKGAKAIHILVPIMQKKDDGEVVLIGFRTAPVFRAEDTEGEALDYEQLEVPELPLMAKAEEWGLSVKAVPGNYRYYGYFSQGRQEIGLASKDECVFFHELVHCAESKLIDLKPGQDPLQEIVADLGAQALCRLVGKSDGQFLGNTYCYIAEYAAIIKLSPYQACLKVLTRTERALNLILKETGDENQEGNHGG
jgi:hypothetical protein